ncbi:MAG: hypothetical protein IKR73_03195 [Oscillospiraceae bacterium]|nr:hypothetical protein [Oscillospiraceae bacterium]
MKTRRFIAGLAAALITVSAVASSASAFDYNKKKYTIIAPPGNNDSPSTTGGGSGTSSTPIYVDPEDDLDRIITEKDIRKSVEYDVPIRIRHDGATITKGGVAEIAKSGKPVVFTIDGCTITIDPASVSEVRAEFIKIRIIPVPEEGATYIYPEGNGGYPFDLEIKVNKRLLPDTMDKETAHLYHIDGSDVEDLGPQAFGADGSATFVISGRSYYKIVGSRILHADGTYEDVSAAAATIADGIDL